METLVISLGGSLIAPDKPDYFFIRELKAFIIRNLVHYRFVIVCGGGKTNSYYNEAALRVSEVSREDLDWIGIMATRLNAELIRAIFGDIANKKVIYDPTKKIRSKSKVIVASGYKPGNSTDHVAVELSRQLGVKRIINLTNTDYVYDKDPRIYPEAVRLFDIRWNEYRKLITGKWTPRLSTPFDPIASKEAQKLKITVAILGKNLKNVEYYLEGKDYQGTVIHA